MALFPAESLPGGSTTGDADGSGCRAVGVVGGQAGCATCEVLAACRPFERMEKVGRAMTQPQQRGWGLLDTIGNCAGSGNVEGI